VVPLVKNEDRNLGMDRNITRRDVIHGVGAVATTALVPGTALADAVLVAEQAGAYPPALTGLRGSHIGSFEVAHRVAREGWRNWGAAQEPDNGVYDLVVVGAGISGLSAAHFYLQENPRARVLILDNHDDFGGHAKRNEFDVGGRKIIGYGGSQTLEAPSSYPAIARKLLRDIGVDVECFDAAYDQEFFKRHDLSGGVFFDRKGWGTDRLLRYDLGGLGLYLPLASSGLSATEFVQQTPMSDAARREFLRLLTVEADRMPDMPVDAKARYLYSISYRDFLTKHIGITEPEVFAALQHLTADAGVGINAAAASTAILYSGLPGYGATGLDENHYDEPYIHHFPDGNASIARLLVRKMIPGVAPGSTMHDVVVAAFDYSKLDIAESQVRLRLNSTVVNVEHDGAAESARTVQATYVQGGQAYRITARQCILACYNTMIPSICPELPEPQRKALSHQVKTPILYTNVALRNWRAWERLGVGAFVAPGGYHVNAMLDFPVSLGDYKYSGNPDEPITVHMERFAHGTGEGLSKQERLRLGRHEMLATPFETIERHIREQLGGALAGGGFDPARDIAAITVNRWAHGYSYMYDFINEPYYPDWNDERYPHVQARRPFGRIAIANSDSGASAMLESAVEQAHRAVAELS